MLNGVSDKESPLKALKPIFSMASVNLANLEIPLTDRGHPTRRKKPADLAARRQFVLHGYPSQVHWLAEAGLDAVCLGNNHAMDFGPSGLSQMEALLQKEGLGFTGAGDNLNLARRVIVKTLPNGIRVGMISALAFATPSALYTCTPATAITPGVNAFNPQTATEWIKTAHQSCDILVVALHGGTERKSAPNANQRRFARLCIDAGADVVWGHHPHVLEGAEIYHGHPILYSMGNLISPLPAKTALLQLHYRGTQFITSTFFPCLISGGKVFPVGQRERHRRYQEWLQLNRLAKRPPESPLPTVLGKYP